ncbi:MAG: hypothetical protein DI539_07200 [Flavobacterium psychrophilum]|nr:MAG: hypothetical protein DI539_07200 [Flavobacterium psychrophilum]
MDEKINYHLATFISELITLLAKEVSGSVKELMKLPKQDDSSLPLLTTDELASALKVSKSHINKLRKKHPNFPVLNIDGSVRFRQSEVEHFFKSLS